MLPIRIALLAACSGTLLAQFSAPTPHVVPGAPSTPTDVAAGDFDADGDRDLVAAHNVAAQLLFYTNAPVGTLSAGPTLVVPLPAGARPRHLATGRLEANAEADVAVADEGGAGAVHVRFQPAGVLQTYTFPGWIPRACTIVDADRDGREDIAVACEDPLGSGTVFLLRQTGPMAFATWGVNWPVGRFPRDIVHGDFNGDHIQDLAVANQASSSVSALVNTGVPGTPAFAAAQNFGLPNMVLRPETLAVADFDCNGFDDVIAGTRGSPNVSVLWGNPPSGPIVNFVHAFQLIGGPGLTYDVAAGDVDCDGDADILVIQNGAPAQVGVARYLGGLAFAPPVFSATTGIGGQPRLCTDDFTNDGTADVATGNDMTPSLSVLRNVCQICCHEYYGGINDQANPSSPVWPEPSCPCPPILAWSATIGSPREPDFDQQVLNEHFIHSFTQLPGNVISATLEIRLWASTLAGATNDGLAIGFDPASSTFLWSRALAALPQTNYAWPAGGNQTLRFDLANLPGGTSLIAHLNCIRCLDFYVQDDTRVDYAVLRIVSGAPSDCDLRMTQTPLVRGTTVVWNTSGSVPGELVALFATLFGPGPGPCFAPGNCLCLDPSASVLLSTSANAVGNSTMSLALPVIGIPPCLQVTTQAVSWPSLRFSPTISGIIY